MITQPQIIASALENPSRIALRDDSKQLTWKEYELCVDLVKRRLLEIFGTENNQVILAWTDPSVEFIVLCSALATLGIPWVGISPTEDTEIAKIKADVLEPNCIIDLQGNRPVLSNEATVISNDIFATTNLLALSTTNEQPRLNTFQSFGFTSGTSGIPKLAVRTKASESRRRATMIRLFGFCPDDSFLVTVPLAHASGHGWARTLLSVGASVRVTNDHSAKNLVRIIHSENITTTLMVPPTLASYLAETTPEEARTIRWVLTGGRHISKRLVDNAKEKLGNNVLHVYYGTTETGVNTIAFPGDLELSPTTAGRPLDGNKVVSLTPDHIICPPGMVGQIAISSYMNFDTYKGIPSEAIELNGEEYVITSDRGYIDTQGYVHIISRKDGVGTASDVPVVHIESDISDIDGVQECAVIAFQNPETELSCFVVLNPSKTATAQSIEGQIQEIISAKYSIQKIKTKFLEFLPCGETGKINAQSLKTHIFTTESVSS